MTVDMKKITQGRIKREPRICVWSAEGVGKTSFSAGAPDPFFLDANKGSAAFDVRRVFLDPDGWDETYEWISAIENGTVKCGTLVLDTASDFESMSHAKLFPGTTVTKAEGGYNKGDDVVIGEWRKLLYRLERIWERGHGVIFTAHARVKNYRDPTGPDYDRHVISLRSPLADLIKSWCDYVLFAQVVTTTTTEKNKPVKAVSTGERVIWTRRTAAYDAKARGTSLFPERLPLSYAEFAKAIESDGARGDLMRQEIESMLAELSDVELEKAVRAYIKRNPTQIADAHNRVKVRLSEKRAAVEQQTQTQENTNGSDDKAGSDQSRGSGGLQGPSDQAG